MLVDVYPITPVPAPRQTRRDTFKTTSKFPLRACVARYRAFQDEVRLRHVRIPSPFHHVVFVLPMPESWSARRKAELEGMPHTSKPDRDNLEKALLDSVYGEDAHVWDGRCTKLWGSRGMLIVSAEPIVIVPRFNLLPFYRQFTSAARVTMSFEP